MLILDREESPQCQESLGFVTPLTPALSPLRGEGVTRHGHWTSFTHRNPSAPGSIKTSPRASRQRPFAIRVVPTDNGVVRTQSPDTSPEAERVWIELLRRTPPWRRLQLADQMSRAVRELSMSGLRLRHPQASEAELRRRFADLHLGSKLARRVYGSICSETNQTSSAAGSRR